MTRGDYPVNLAAIHHHFAPLHLHVRRLLRLFSCDGSFLEGHNFRD